VAKTLPAGGTEEGELMKLARIITPDRFAKWAIGVFVVLTVAVAGVIVYSLSSGLPTLEQLENPPQELATRVYSADGVMLELFATTRRTNLAYDSIPRGFINALVATEDRAFYDHWGVHLMRIVKAAVKNVFAFRAKEGASTITQQLARNLYFTQEQTLGRKIREAWTALQIERAYTKNEILEMYANTVYYGRGAYGLRVASLTYFNKEPMKLSVAECAYLVGLFKAPERYGVDDSLGAVRRNLILGMMRDAEYLTEEEYSTAVAEPLRKAPPSKTYRGIAPHFVEMVRQSLTNDDVWKERLAGHDLYRDGLVIYTTLDSRVQKYANQALDEHLREYQKVFDNAFSWKSRQQLLQELLARAVRRHTDYLTAAESDRESAKNRLLSNRSFVDSVKRMATLIQSGLVVIEPSTGNIVGMVGSSPLTMELQSAARYSLNHATQIRRQPGSSFKPFVYASALESSETVTPETMVESGPFSYMLDDGTVWAPQGSREGGGPIALRSALKFSLNSVAARLVTDSGFTTPTQVVEMCQKLGISSPLSAVPSIALGTGEVSPLEITSAYAAFANQGVYTSSGYISRIEDRMGNILYEAKPFERISNEACSQRTADYMISMMRGVVDGGTASSIRKFYRYDAAGKTGTTNDFADAWFVGITPQLACGVWVGFDDMRIRFTGDYGQGGRAAAPIWGRLMQKVYNDPAVRWRKRSFAVERDSTDVVTDIDISNPVQETAPFRQPDTTKKR
jgi:penicillin-binding protein 1A